MKEKVSFSSLKDFIDCYYAEIQAIIDCINVGIYITDDNANTLMLNNESEKTGGLNRTELIGRNMRDLMEEGYIAESASLKVIASGNEENIIQRLGDGGQIFTTAIPLRRKDKTEIVMCTERDITETIKLKELLQEKELITKKYEMELEYLRKQNAQVDKDMVFHSKIMSGIVQMAFRVAKLDTTVLITGESGTGKEVLANYIYQNSLRRSEPFIKVNCAAIPENLLESEFFGYEKGAFTGAERVGKVGIFELANNGTLFLDEIGDLPLQMQSKLLRAIQEKEIMRIGGKKAIPTDVRIIAATNANLKKAISDGRFREDLYYRLNIIPLEIPPLRNRKEDIAKLAVSFVEQFNKKYKERKIINENAVQTLMNYDWPGNIRELKNILERIIVTTDGDEITQNQINNQIFNDVATIPGLSKNNGNDESLQELVERFEKNLLQNVRSQCTTACAVAKILKVNKSTISKKFKKYGIKPND